MKKLLSMSCAVAAALMLAGCGGGGDDDTTSVGVTGYFVDAPVANLTYDCVLDGTSGTTDASGAFWCQNRERIRFRVGQLVLGEIAELPSDGYVFPQDVVGTTREDVANPAVLAMAQLIQSLDVDANPDNGILIDENLAANLPPEEFDPSKVTTYLQIAHVPPERIRTQEQVQVHLMAMVQTVQQTQTAMDVSSGKTDELAKIIHYINNEEKMARDLYGELYHYHIDENLRTLSNITQSEQRHVESIENMAQKYGLPKASELEVGVFDEPTIQQLYDTLYTKGMESVQAALEVGCIVEVVDIQDLDRDIKRSYELGAQDLAGVLSNLREGSYNHYRAFDKSLKNRGEELGCCAAGEEYCHPEYLQR
jgi:hypothetical protein